MIVRFFVDLIFVVIYLIVALIPTLPGVESLNVSLQPLFYAINFVNLFFDVPMMGRCLGLVLVALNAKFVWSVLRWTISKLPGVSA